MNIKGHNISPRTYTSTHPSTPMSPLPEDIGFSQVSLLAKTIGPAFGGTIDTTGQLLNKTDTVELDVYQGIIVTADTELAAGDTVTFTLINSLINIGDNVVLSMLNAQPGTYIPTVDDIGAGGCTISLFNHSSGNVSESVVLMFTVIKGIIPPTFFP